MIIKGLILSQPLESARSNMKRFNVHPWLALFAVMVLLLISLGCGKQQDLSPARIETVTIAPTSGSGNFTVTAVVVSGAAGAELKCSVPDENDPSKSTTKLSEFVKEAAAGEFNTQVYSEQFFLTEPGEYRVSCALGDANAEASFMVTEEAPVPPVTAAPGIGPESAVCLQWDVGGTWEVTQSNDYHPVLTLTQNSIVLSGSATLPADEQARADFSSPTGTVSGTLVGNKVSLFITWPPRNRDKAVLTGTYQGTVTEVRIEGTVAPNDTWTGTGPARCAD